MFDQANYRLLEFANGEKLEQFGGVSVRRQTPSVPLGQRQLSRRAGDAALQWRRKNGGAGQWTGAPANPWMIRHDQNVFQLRPTPTGQVGVFPEQAENWQWIADRPGSLAGQNALNLFGYTGGTTQALAHAGASVTHVDAAKTVVAWARENAKHAGLADHPIRWITEDALRFVQREIDRGRTYQIVVADPPSFGRGPSRETWKMSRDLPRLLEGLASLTAGQTQMILISGHTPGFDERRLATEVAGAWGLPRRTIDAHELTLTAEDERTLPSGCVARWAKDIR